jgi:hypothetical protein
MRKYECSKHGKQKIYAKVPAGDIQSKIPVKSRSTKDFQSEREMNKAGERAREVHKKRGKLKTPKKK